MAVNLTLHTTKSPGEVSAAIQRLAVVDHAPPMPTSVRGRLIPAKLRVQFRGDGFVLGYRSIKQPGPRAEARGRISPSSTGSTVEVRIGLNRQMTLYNGIIGCAVALPFVLMAEWLIAGVLIGVSCISTGINQGFDAAMTLENEEAGYLTRCLEHATQAVPTPRLVSARMQ